MAGEYLHRFYIALMEVQDQPQSTPAEDGTCRLMGVRKAHPGWKTVLEKRDRGRVKTQSGFAGKALTAAQLEETVDLFRTRLVGQPEVVEVLSNVLFR